MKLTASSRSPSGRFVAPFTGAWIETRNRERERKEILVAPFTGAWIETPAGQRRQVFSGRTLHGCVD